MKFIQLTIVCLFVFTSFTNSFCQDEINFDGERKAFIYHVVWKNKRLNDYFGKYFEYIGEPYFKRDGETPKRDSIEIAIKSNPNKLLIRSNDLSKVSKGMLLELTNKLALHDLNLMIKHRNSEEPQHEKFRVEYETLVDLLTKKLPPSTVKEKDGKLRPLIKFEKILAPTYSTKGKINVVSSGGAFDASETKMIVKAINNSIQIWVTNRSRQYFEAFGGRANYLNNQLMSAGDGGGFAGSGKERKQDEWYRGLTHPIGFFYYEIDTKKEVKSGKMVVKSKHVPVIDYVTYGHDTITNIHFDVWGQSKERQTTVVIQKGMYSYILYGKDETELLSPDSTYGKEGITTYQMLIDELENVHIAHYDNLIYGKRGYDWQIEYHGKQVELCLEKIKVTEYKLNQIRYSQGSGNLVNYKPKDPKKSQPNSNSSVKKKKMTTQEELMYWYEKWEFHKGMIVKLKKEKVIALEILATLKDKLGEMNKNLGYKILKYEEKDGLYIFEDSSTFNYETQDFKFNKYHYPEEYNIRMLSFDEKVLSSQADEVMIHWSVTEEDEDEKLAVNKLLLDQFKLNEFSQDFSIFQESDSVKVKELIQFIIDNPKNITLNLSGEGLGTMLPNGKYKKNKQPEYFNEYPNNKEIYKDLNASTIQIDLEDELIISIRTYTDGLKANFKPFDKTVIKLLESGAIYPNEAIAGLRTQTVLYNMIYDINKNGAKYFDEGEAEKAFDILLNVIKKHKIFMGNKSFKAYMKMVKAKL
jgi:hypothetical protein